eukprot:16087038-Heterocapsa_arctica.AAC.1
MPNLPLLKKHIDHFSRKGKHAEAGMLSTIAVGGTWTKDRRCSAGMLDHRTCDLCNTGAVQD